MHNNVRMESKCRTNGMTDRSTYRVAQKSKPLPNNKKIVLDRIKAGQ